MQEAYKTYDVSETLNGVKTKTTPKLGTRFSDQGLADLPLSDDAMNFWCPQSNVRENLKIVWSEATGLNMGLPAIKSLPLACKSKLYADYEKRLSGTGKDKYECCGTGEVPGAPPGAPPMVQVCRSCKAPATTTITTTTTSP